MLQVNQNQNDLVVKESQNLLALAHRVDVGEEHKPHKKQQRYKHLAVQDASSF
jgi:hypothetical protein